jgi:multiple sugar transport system ATP-binding protein
MIYVTHDQLEAMTLASQVAIMKEGTVQQIAPPLELYNAPANKFVAGFIGNPPMNFVPAKVAAEGKGVKLMLGKEGNGGSLELTNGYAKKLLPYIGKSIVMGVRPEDIYDKVYYMGDAKGRTMKTVVDVVEPMGAEKYLYLSSMGGQAMVARVNADNQAHVKQNIDVVVKLENAKFFDSETDAIIQ